MKVKQPWPIYPSGSKAQVWQRCGAVLGVVTLIYTVYAVLAAAPCEFPSRLLLLAALWGLVPPLWWWFEFFFVFPHHYSAEKFELVKHGAQASLAIWAPIALALAAFSSSDYFKKPESGNCIHASAIQASPATMTAPIASGVARSTTP